MVMRNIVTREDLSARIARVPRVSLAHLPTPLENCPRLSEALGGPRILIKRDDMGGLAMSGNKNRYLEFVMGDAKAKGANAIIICSGNQSNHCRQTAAAAAKLGMKAVLVFTGARPKLLQGNLILDHLLGAEMRFLELGERGGSLPGRAIIDEVLERIAEEMRQQGRKPYVINHAPPALSAVAYANCAIELSEQLEKLGIEADYVVATSTGGTQAGLVLGTKALGMSCQVRGVCYHRTSLEGLHEGLAEQVNDAAKVLGLPVHVEADEIVNYGEYTDDYLFDKIGKRLPMTKLIAQTEGILTDPSYVGRALYMIADKIDQGEFTSSHTIVLVHTGGIPIIFDQAEELL